MAFQFHVAINKVKFPFMVKRTSIVIAMKDLPRGWHMLDFN
jgi:hypothetical protein